MLTVVVIVPFIPWGSATALSEVSPQGGGYQASEGGAFLSRIESSKMEKTGQRVNFLDRSPASKCLIESLDSIYIYI